MKTENLIALIVVLVGLVVVVVAVAMCCRRGKDSTMGKVESEPGAKGDLEKGEKTELVSTPGAPSDRVQDDAKVKVQPTQKTEEEKELAAYQTIVKTMWNDYDKDKSGSLDKTQAKKMTSMALFHKFKGDVFDVELFEQNFKKHEESEEGKIKKDDMAEFVRSCVKAK